MPLKLYILRAGVAYLGTEISVTGMKIFPPHEHSSSGAWDKAFLTK